MALKSNPKSQKSHQKNRQKSVVKKTTKKVRKTVTKFKKAAKKSIKQVTKVAKKVYKKAKKVVRKKYNQVKRTVKKKVQTVKKAGKKVITKAKSTIKSISKTTKKQTIKAGTKLAVSQANHSMRVQKTMKAICDGVPVISVGVVDAYASNITMGAVDTIYKNKDVYGDNNLYYIGRLIADASSFLTGIGGIVGGGTLAGVGVGLDTTGVGAVAGVPANIAGVTIATGGAALASNSGANFVQDAKDLFSNIEKGKGNNSNISSWIKDNRVPLDKETILSTFKKTKNRVKGATVYEKSGKFYHRDTLHKGERAHLEVYDKKGKHLGEADPVTGEIIPNTADSTKRLPK
ncbi:hypothetical protein CSI37_12370 [Listeria monocytogenes]|nr:hypothetical protein [Listeria monocytogenes]EAF3121209.1 hypothetical protein [Listeria monocytogenes]EAF3130278.1 hypothetical protein [Listeria monocytogenes]EAF3133812.1 hypothetical protein [Listeria monocytogenes]EAF3139222.1 hypothetical protein [Listeria monocytogenes]